MQRTEIDTSSQQIQPIIAEIEHLISEANLAVKRLSDLRSGVKQDTPESRLISIRIDTCLENHRVNISRLESDVKVARELITRIEKRIIQQEVKEENVNTNIKADHQARLIKANEHSALIGRKIARLQGDYVEANAKYQAMISSPAGTERYVSDLKEVKKIVANMKAELDKVKVEKASYDVYLSELVNDAHRLVDIKLQKYRRIRAQQFKILDRVKNQLAELLEECARQHERYVSDIAALQVDDELELLMDSRRHLIEVVEEDESTSPEVKHAIINSAEVLVSDPQNTEARETLDKIVQEGTKPKSGISAVIVGSVLAFLGVVTIAVSAALLVAGVTFPFACIGIAAGCAVIAAGILLAGIRPNHYSFFANYAGKSLNNESVSSKDNFANQAVPCEG